MNFAASKENFQKINATNKHAMEMIAGVVYEMLRDKISRTKPPA